MNKCRYTLVRGYYQEVKGSLFNRTEVRSEEIDCKTLKEAIELGSILSQDEKPLSYIFDNAAHKKLTLRGEC